MTKIDIDRFICDFLKCIGDHYIFEEEKFIHYALKQQGLEYKSGEIVEIDQPPLTEEHKPKTIKFNELEVDIDKMVEEYKSTLDHTIGWYSFEIKVSAYKRGLEDMLKLIKEGGSNESTD